MGDWKRQQRTESWVYQKLVSAPHLKMLGCFLILYEKTWQKPACWYHFSSKLLSLRLFTLHLSFCFPISITVIPIISKSSEILKDRNGYIKNSVWTEDLKGYFGSQLFAVHCAHTTGCFIFMTDQFHTPFTSLTHLGLLEIAFVKLTLAQWTLNKYWSGLSLAKLFQQIFWDSATLIGNNLILIPQ